MENYTAINFDKTNQINFKKKHLVITRGGGRILLEHAVTDAASDVVEPGGFFINFF